MMTNAAIDPRYLELFPQWLRSLGEDTAAVGDAISSSSLDDQSTRWLVAGVNYIFKSLDLIPDGIDDLGFLDDAFVLRVACAFALPSAPHDGAPETAASKGAGSLRNLAEDVHSLREFLGPDYARLESYVRDLQKGGARGRSVDDVVSDPAIRDAFLRDVRQWCATYRAPSFNRDPKTLVKLKAFLGAKLP